MLDDQVGAISRWRVWPIVGISPDRSVDEPNMIVFHDDIGGLVLIFGRFSR
jgi:hypothetical protein